MTVTRNVIQDLLPLYAAGEASADSERLVAEYLKQDQEMVRLLEAMRSEILPEAPVTMRASHEKDALNTTKALLNWRGTLMGVGIFLTLALVSCRFDGGRIGWTFFEGMPVGVTALTCVLAAGCWGGFFYVRRRLGGTGL